MPKEIFRLTSAGGVDDGKSTILARLLLDTGNVYDDQMTKNHDPNKIADLLDGLESEKSQGITIDVAHRFFDSRTRRYQIADSPGHEQYTRNMATASAGSDALMLVVDAQTGLKPQTNHHLEIAMRLGIRNVIFAVNKMDLVGFSQKKFNKISNEIEHRMSLRSHHFPGMKHIVVPVSGLTGTNVVVKSKKLSWFSGNSLLDTLDSLKLTRKKISETLIEIQMVQRLAGGGRRYLGRVLSGELTKGQRLFSESKEVYVTRLFVAGKEAGKAKTACAVSFDIDKDLDLNRGQIMSARKHPTHDQYEADLIWLSEYDGQKGRKYILNSLSSQSNVSITKINALDLDSDTKQGEKSTVGTNEIVRAKIALSESSWLRPIRDYFDLGRFTLVAPETGQTAAVGTVRFPLRRSSNVTRHQFSVSPAQHAALLNTRPRVFWFTGLSGSGKTTIADKISQILQEKSLPHFVLDGDNLRTGLNIDLGFTQADRTENVRRVAEVAKLMVDAGLIVIATLITPKNSDRALARQIIGGEKFTLVYIDTPLELCEQRDPKGLYKKARSGQIPNMTGIGMEFEIPKDADLKARSFRTVVREILGEDGLE